MREAEGFRALSRNELVIEKSGVRTKVLIIANDESFAILTRGRKLTTARIVPAITTPFSNRSDNDRASLFIYLKKDSPKLLAKSLGLRY